MIRICENENWIVDYFEDTRTYRVSFFEDGHFVDDYCFDAHTEIPQNSVFTGYCPICNHHLVLRLEGDK